MSRQLRLLCLVALSLVTLSHVTTVTAACLDPVPLRLAQIPLKDSAEQARQMQPLIAHLESRLGRQVSFHTALSYGAVVEGLLAGSYDVAELGPAAYADAVARGAPIEAFAAFAGPRGIVFDTRAGYHSALVVARDSGLTRAGLQGKALALTDPDSTSGALLPQRMAPALLGSPLTEYFGTIHFVGSHARAIAAVQNGLVDAAFVSTTQIDNAIRAGTLAPDALHVLWQSEPMPLDPWVVHRQLCPEVAAALREAFLNPGPTLQPWLERMGRPDGYRVVDDTHYAAIRAAYERHVSR